MFTLQLAMLATAGAASGAATYDVVAVMPLTSLGSTEEAADAIERVLVAEFGKLVGEKLIPPAELASRARAGKGAFESCEGGVPCLLEVVGALGWDAFVVGNIAGLGDERVINLKLIDVRVGGEVRRAAAKTSGDESEMIRHIRKAAVTLLAPEQLVGTLDLRCEQIGIRIAVDGALVGTTPLANGKLPVAVGRHAIEATGEGRVAFERLVDIEYGEDKRIDISLPSNTVFVGGDTPFAARWYTWAIGGAGLLGVGLGGYFNYLQADAAERLGTRAEKGTLRGDGAELYDEEAANWSRAVVFYAAGGVLLAGVGVLFGIDFLSE